MIPVLDIYRDCEDQVNSAENGQFSYDVFNRWSWQGQLRLLDWLSGDVSGVTAPEAFQTQKNRDWLSDFITKKEEQVTEGIVIKPDDYYLWENMYLLRGIAEVCDDDSDAVHLNNIPVKLLDNPKFNQRLVTNIDDLKPSQDKVYAKTVGRTFEFAPKDPGSLVLEYVRYPVKAKIAIISDQVDEFGEQIIDTANTVDFEWGEYARTILTWFIVDSFTNRTRESAEKQLNLVTGKTAREARA